MPLKSSPPQNFGETFRANILARGAPLFEEGDPAHASDQESYIKRINRYLSIHVRPHAEKVPASLAEAITKTGNLNKNAELIVFGQWLIIAGMPGYRKRRGKPIDPRAILKVVACALAAQQAHAYESKLAGETVAARPFHLTSKRVVEQQQRLFAEQSSTRNYTAPLRSIARILPEYLAYLKTGRLSWHGTVVTTSAGLAQLNLALAKSSVTSPTASVIRPLPTSMPSAAPVAPALLRSDFKIELFYSSAAQEREYRNIIAPHPPIPELSYTIGPILPTSHSASLRKDRNDMLVFTPDFIVQKELRVRALIDRMVIVLKTSKSIDAKTLHNEISAKTSATQFVHDRSPSSFQPVRTREGKNPWVDQLPELASPAPKGTHFAIQVQDPKPKVLSAVIKAVTECVGIDGPIQLFLLELAVDFYPRGTYSPGELLIGREKIVALLQRHHWASHQRLLDETAVRLKMSDARQVYNESAGKRKTRHLFPKTSEMKLSDSQVDNPEVKKRILKAGKGNDLYLNSQIYRGTRKGNIQTNVQHKIADHRDEKKGTAVPLTLEECRGRVECTLTGFEALEAVGIKDVSDLSNVSFKTMAKQLIRFRLPTTAATTKDITETITQMTHRGVYGIELRRRAAHLAERECKSPKPRKKDREGLGLVDWPEMNKAVGDALGRLATQWKKF